jgi:hypothetical protein
MTKRSTTEEFVASARLIHGEKYCYDKSIYERNSIKITITCIIHGDFLQSPNSHLQGSGCRVCGLEAKVAGRRKTADQFILEAIKSHGDKYTYEMAEYKNANTKVCINCQDHGSFLITPNSLISGQGCYKCSLSARGLKRRKPFDDFLIEARNVHGEKYQYDRETYRDSSTKMVITCSVHGSFDQVPKSHLTGRGCSDCAQTGFNPEHPAHVYCLVSDDCAFIKVGITGNMRTRMAALKCKTPFGFKIAGDLQVDGSEARRIESEFHNRHESAGLSGFQGATEWLRYNEEIISSFA